MNEASIQTAIDMFRHTLSHVKDAVMAKVDANRISARLGDNFETVNSPISISLDFYVLEHSGDDDVGVCLSVSFQNHMPVLGGLKQMRSNELYAYADLFYEAGGQISNFGIVRLDIEDPGFKEKLSYVSNAIALYLESQIPIVVEKLNECLDKEGNRS
jgi:hypothetical protein